MTGDNSEEGKSTERNEVDTCDNAWEGAVEGVPAKHGKDQLLCKEEGTEVTRCLN